MLNIICFAIKFISFFTLKININNKFDIQSYKRNEKSEGILKS